MRALVFLVLAACSNDQFSTDDAGADADADAEAGPKQDVFVPDVIEEEDSAPVDGGPTTFCASLPKTSYFFCDDFDALANVTDSFSVWTPGSIAFGPGLAGQGIFVTAVALSSPTVYITKQVQGNPLKELDFEIQLGSVTLATYVRVTAGSSAFGLGVDLSSNFTIQGDASTNSTLAKADTNWRPVVVKFENGKANVSIDGKAPIAVTFAAVSSTQSSVDLGVVVGTLGGKVTFDNVVLR